MHADAVNGYTDRWERGTDHSHPTGHPPGLRSRLVGEECADAFNAQPTP